MQHDPDAVAIADLTDTRESLHRLGEHVLAAARYASDGRIGLKVVPGGIATPPFGPEGRTAAVIGTDLIVSDAGGTHGQDVSTLRHAATALGIDAGGPSQVYRLSTPCDLDALLPMTHQAADQLAAWLNLAGAALRQFVDNHAGGDDRQADRAVDEPPTITLWPEHFDLGVVIGACNYGASPGDAGRPEPYLYVGPHDAEARHGTDTFWNEPYGAAVSWRDIPDIASAVAFFESGLAHLS